MRSLFFSLLVTGSISIFAQDSTFRIGLHLVPQESLIYYDGRLRAGVLLERGRFSLAVDGQYGSPVTDFHKEENLRFLDGGYRFRGLRAALRFRPFRRRIHFGLEFFTDRLRKSAVRSFFQAYNPTRVVSYERARFTRERTGWLITFGQLLPLGEQFYLDWALGLGQLVRTHDYDLLEDITVELDRDLFRSDDEFDWRKVTLTGKSAGVFIANFTIRVGRWF